MILVVVTHASKVVRDHYDFIKVGSLGNYGADTFNLISVSVECIGHGLGKGDRVKEKPVLLVLGVIREMIWFWFLVKQK